jgi:hypothetical protein
MKQIDKTIDAHGSRPIKLRRNFLGTNIYCVLIGLGLAWRVSNKVTEQEQI